MAEECISTFVVAVPVGSEIHTVDGIAYEGKLWLVPYWLESPREQARKPMRMIRFDNLEHHELGPDALWLYHIDRQVPEAVLEGHISGGFEILSGTQITFGLRYSPDNHN